MDITVPCSLEWNGVGGMVNVSPERDDAHGEENNYTYSMERVATKTSNGAYSMESNGVLLQIEKTCHQVSEWPPITIGTPASALATPRGFWPPITIGLPPLLHWQLLVDLILFRSAVPSENGNQHYGSLQEYEEVSVVLTQVLSRLLA